MEYLQIFEVVSSLFKIVLIVFVGAMFLLNLYAFGKDENPTAGIHAIIFLIVLLEVIR